ncbi:glycosyltransferase family 4 protein [Marinobacteraceae bacterium S3BR75-40.1]
MLTNEFPPSIGGVQTHVDELSRALVALGHEVHVITRWKDKATAKLENRDGVQVHRIPLAKSHWFYDRQLRRQIRKLHREGPVDILHVHGMRPLKACGGLGIPVVFTNHTSSFLRRVKQTQKVRDKMLSQLRVAQLILAPSEELADATRECGYTGPVTFIANGVDVEKFSPGNSGLRKRLDIPADAFVVALARRLYEKNGVLFLAEAVAKLNHPRLHLVVAGAGSDREAFEKIVGEGGVAGRTHMLGGVANAEMPELYRGCDVSVLPSLLEATSIAGLEAMACGLPLIGTNVGGIPAILRNGDNGLLVEPRSPQQLADALGTLISDPERCRQMGQRSRERAVEEFSWNSIAQKTLEAYAGIPG